MNSKISSLKEKMRQALTSTMKVISEDFKIKDHKSKDTNTNNSEALKTIDLSNPQDFIKLIL